MKKIHRKFNFIAALAFPVGAYFLYNYINSGIWKYLGPSLLVLLAFGNLGLSFEKETEHEKKYPPGTGAMIYLQAWKQFWKDSNKKK